ncbi:MAG: hypothetical protein ACRD0J_18360 [Acidimicrobiales bacterium]
MPKRGDPVSPPPRPGEWQLRFAESAAGSGWEQLCKQAPGPTRAAYEIMATHPSTSANPHRQHRLRGDLGRRTVAGKALDQ